MSLHYILDGYNIIKHHDFSVENKLKDARAGLIRFIKENKPCGSRRNSITIVFDGRSDVFSPKLDIDIEVIFTKNESADEKIKSMVELSSNPKRIAVVTDDKQIQYLVRSLGAKVISVRNFIQHPKYKTKVISNSEEELSPGKARAITEELKKVWLR